MCRQCTTIDPGSEASVSITFRVRIRDILDRIDHLLRCCNNLEDRYREAGIAFHKTERACRLACERNTEWAVLYANLEKTFLIDSYEDIFAPLNDMVTRLMKLRIKVQHVPSAATAGELMVAFWHDLAPPTDALIAEFETFKQYISKLQSDAYTLRLFNKKYFQVNDLGVHNVWYDPVVDMINNKRTVRSRVGEFTLFADWVHSLPEAQRALEVQAGHDGFNLSGTLFEDRLFAYSMDLIWRTNERFIPDRHQPSRGLQHERT